MKVVNYRQNELQLKNHLRMQVSQVLGDEGGVNWRRHSRSYIALSCMCVITLNKKLSLVLYPGYVLLNTCLAARLPALTSHSCGVQKPAALAATNVLKPIIYLP